MDVWTSLSSDSRASPIRSVANGLALALLGLGWSYYAPLEMTTAGNWDMLGAFLAPLLVLTVLAGLLSRVANIASRENIDSIAEFMTARYGNNRDVGLVVTAIAGLAGALIIAQQVRMVAMGWQSLAGVSIRPVVLDLIATASLAAIAIFIGARRPSLSRRNQILLPLNSWDGLLKFIGFVALAAFGTTHFGLKNSTPSESLLARFDGGFLLYTALSMGAILTAPHVFQLFVVRYGKDREWDLTERFSPLYFGTILACVTWTVLNPVLFHGNLTAQTAFPPDMRGGFIWRLTLFSLTLITAICVTATTAYCVASMLTKHWLPGVIVRLWRRSNSSVNLGRGLMIQNRIAILAVIALACGLYYPLRGANLLSIGLLYCSACCQLLPALIVGLVWRRAHAFGAMAGMLAGVVLWLVFVALPAIDTGGVARLTFSPWRLAPPSLDLGIILSLTANLGLTALISLLVQPRLVDRIQAAAFIDVDNPEFVSAPFDRKPDAEVSNANLRLLLVQFLGEQDAAAAIAEIEGRLARKFPNDARISPDIAREVERVLAGVVGASLARSIFNWHLAQPAGHSSETIHFVEQTAQAIRLNREMLQATLNNLSQGVCVVDRDFHLVAWNSRYTEIFELGPGMIRVGTSLADIIRLNRSRSGYSAEDTEKYIRRRLRDVRVGIPHVFERNWSNGKTLRVVGMPMSDGRYVTSFTDVSSVQNVIADLRQANQMLEERVRLRTAELTRVNEALKQSTIQAERARASQARFLAAASHDLLQPLHAARLFLGALQEHADGGEEQADLAHNADVSIETANRLLNALLNLSRLEVGGLTPEVRPVAVSTIFANLEREFTPLAKSRGLTFRILSTKHWVMSDEDLLRSILQNLIGNAIRYTETGAVLVLCRKRRGDIVFEVRDSGPGIPGDKLDRVFEEYVRLSHGPDVEKGLGLGLSIVRRICDVLHHRVTVRSQLNRGTTFSVFVSQAMTQSAFVPSASNASALNGLKVLCVEDDRAIRSGLETLLKRWGANAEFVDTVEEALSLPGVWDAILTDYHFGENKNGLDLIEAFRTRAPVYALITAEAGVEVLQRANEMGVNVIRKPVSPATLRMFLSRASNLKSSRPV